jgi:hypothetical protein
MERLSHVDILVQVACNSEIYISLSKHKFSYYVCVCVCITLGVDNIVCYTAELIITTIALNCSTSKLY